MRYLRISEWLRLVVEEWERDPTGSGRDAAERLQGNLEAAAAGLEAAPGAVVELTARLLQDEVVHGEEVGALGEGALPFLGALLGNGTLERAYELAESTLR